MQAKNVDAATEALTQYQDTLSEEQITQFVKEGLAIDENHLGLRVLAENKLGWSVKKTAGRNRRKNRPWVMKKPNLVQPTMRGKRKETETERKTTAQTFGCWAWA